MFYLKMFLFLLLTTYAFESNAIINGKKAEKEKMLFNADIYGGYKYSHLCGATILNDRFILTAEHCVEDINPAEIRILVNVFEDRKIKKNEYKEVKKIHHADSYKISYEVNDLMVDLGFKDKQTDLAIGDIAVIELMHPITDNVDSVTFSNYDKTMDIYTIGKGAIENSDQFTLEKQYGTQKDIDHLLYVTRSKPTLRIAQLSHDVENIFCDSDLIICTKNYNEKKEIYTGIGSGDSGAALLSYNKIDNTYSQIGITSFSKNLYNTDESFAAFTSIEKHLHFLQPFIDKGKSLKYDKDKGHNDFIGMGDGLTEDEATKHFEEIIIKNNRMAFIKNGFMFLGIIIGLCFLVVFLDSAVEKKKKSKKDKKQDAFTYKYQDEKTNTTVSYKYDNIK